MPMLNPTPPSSSKRWVPCNPSGARKTIKASAERFDDPYTTSYESNFSNYWESKNRYLAGDWKPHSPSQAKDDLKISYTFNSPDEEDFKEDMIVRKAKGARRITEYKMNERQMQSKIRELEASKKDHGNIWE
jgi:hypothetical protein